MKFNGILVKIVTNYSLEIVLSKTVGWDLLDCIKWIDIGILCDIV
jgi:hypothetical protein